MGLLMAAALGAAAGYLEGRRHSRQVAELKLTASATQLAGLTDGLRDQIRTLLDALNASNLPACSDAELARFRQLVYHSVDIRDAGRMHDGRLECSADFGRDHMPHTQFHPSITLLDGTEVYINLSPYFPADALVNIFQHGNFFVVEDPNTINRWKMINKDYETYMQSSPDNNWRRVSGLPPRLSVTIADHDGQGRVGDTLYATRCSAHSACCAVAYGSLAEAMQADRRMLILHAVCGALLGAFLVLAFLFIWWHSRSMAQQLRRAIRKDEIRMVYQPIVDLYGGRVVGAEALARWTDEDGYAVSPEIFVRLAEERGFMDELTRLVVRHALSDFGKLLHDDPDFKLHINVTASGLADAKFISWLEDSLAQANVAPHSIALEVTEGSTACKPVAMEAIRHIREWGHCILIDDFGTGYSSLAYLKDLAIDAIKIDRAFVQTIGTEALIGGILPQILAMAETLKLDVVVEGIETAEQADYFRKTGKPMLGQGSLFGQPVPANEFLILMN